MSAAVEELGMSFSSSPSLPLTHSFAHPRTRTHSLLHLRTAHSLTFTPTHTDKKYGPITLPIFISVAPARDTPTQITTYLTSFHPRLIGLTGSYPSIKSTCKAYRVYFSTPPSAQPTDDYLVDHSIFFYLMDPQGRFVEAFGRGSEVGDVVGRVEREVEGWRERTGRVV